MLNDHVDDWFKCHLRSKGLTAGVLIAIVIVANFIDILAWGALLAAPAAAVTVGTWLSLLILYWRIVIVEDSIPARRPWLLSLCLKIYLLWVCFAGAAITLYWVHALLLPPGDYEIKIKYLAYLIFSLFLWAGLIYGAILVRMRMPRA